MLDPARRTTFVGTFRVAPVARRIPLASPDAAATRPGLPRTAAEWTALVKVASGELDIPRSHRARLLALGLIQSTAGVTSLTRHGELTLGLPG